MPFQGSCLLSALLLTSTHLCSPGNSKLLEVIFQGLPLSSGWSSSSASVVGCQRSQSACRLSGAFSINTLSVPQQLIRKRPTTSPSGRVLWVLQVQLDSSMICWRHAPAMAAAPHPSNPTQTLPAVSTTFCKGCMPCHWHVRMFSAGLLL
jgi:hypothetical protein